MLTTLRLYLASTENPTETRNEYMRYTQPQILNSTKATVTWGIRAKANAIPL
jgi:hypothetical protein